MIDSLDFPILASTIAWRQPPRASMSSATIRTKIWSGACETHFPHRGAGFRELFLRHRAEAPLYVGLPEIGKCSLVFYSLDVRTDDRNGSDLGPLTVLIEGTAPSLAMIRCRRYEPGSSWLCSETLTRLKTQAGIVVLPG